MAKIQKGKNRSTKPITLDRRSDPDRRQVGDRRRSQAAVAVERRGSSDRRKISRRRQIDPTTCERDYSQDELDFMRAMDEYKRANGRMFPTCSEILEVVRTLGYEKRPTVPADGTCMSPSHCETPDRTGLEGSDN